MFPVVIPFAYLVQETRGGLVMSSARWSVGLAVILVGVSAAAAFAADAQEMKPLPVALGMSMADVEAKLGKPQATVALPDSGGAIWEYQDRNARVAISFDRGYVSRILQAAIGDDAKKATAAEAKPITLVKVSGTVKFKDGALIPSPEAGKGPPPTINFRPVGTAAPGQARKGAGALIKADGTFEVMTFKPRDGLIPGKYAVSIGSDFVPEKYRDADTSGLEIDIQKPTSDLAIELEKQ
jgi:hypothetical protein